MAQFQTESVAHFRAEPVAQFVPEQVAQFVPEQVAQFRAEWVAGLLRNTHLDVAGCANATEAHAKGLINDDEAQRLNEVSDAVARVIAVDDFPAGELGELNFSANKNADEKRESS